MKNNKNLYHRTGSKAFGLLLLLLLSAVTQAQNILAQYPLEVEGFKTMRFYDVSGNGRHSRLVNNSKDDVEKIFVLDSFPNSVKCIRKSMPSDAYLSLPDIYKDTDTQTTGFAVSFWLYVDNSAPFTNPEHNILISLPQFTVTLERASATSTRLSLFYPTVTPSEISIPKNLDKKGWYFVSLDFWGGNSDMISYYTYFYDGMKYDPDSHAMDGKDMEGNGNLITALPARPNRIYSAGFTGKLWNVKFYDHGRMSSGQVNADRNNSWYMASGNVSTANADNFYVINAMQSYYPCERFVSNQAVLVDLKGSRSSTAAADYKFVPDRFGATDKSIAFTKNGYAKLPLFTKDTLSSEGINPLEGYSVSFWTNVDQMYGPPPNSVFPYSDTDMRYQFMSLAREYDKEDYGGFCMIRDRFVINRFVDRNPMTVWKLWLWDKVSFQNLKGWYHVVFSQKENAIRVIMYKPDGQVASRLNYFMPQDYNAVKGLLFFVGANPSSWPDNYQNACKSIDDIRIYNWPLSQAEADVLHAYEAIKQ